MNRDQRAIEILRDYIRKDIIKRSIIPEEAEKNIPEFDVYVVWKCKVLQNAKYLLCTNLPDMMYYEITYNGDKKEWYLDAYNKVENVVYKEE